MSRKDYGLTVFEHTINLSNNTELIKVFGDNSVIEEGLTDSILEGNLFYSVCDLLSVDFEKLILQIKEVFKEATKKNIFEMLRKTLKNHNYLLMSTEVLFSIKEWYDYGTGNPFMGILVITEYIDRLERDTILQNADVFFTYVSSWCNFSVQQYSIFYYRKLSDAIRKALDEKGIDNRLDRFLKYLSIDKIIENKTDYKVYQMMAYDLMEFVCSNIYYILSHGMTIKRCANCGKFFVAYNRSDTLYCDRQSPQAKDWTCKEYASKRGWYEKQRKNETAKLYRNIYQQKQMLSRRNPDIAEYKSDFERFKTAAKEWKNKVKKGETAENDYLQWLKDVKEKKVIY